jgi:hypothetical protein
MARFFIFTTTSKLSVIQPAYYFEVNSDGKQFFQLERFFGKMSADLYLDLHRYVPGLLAILTLFRGLIDPPSLYLRSSRNLAQSH